MPVTPTGQFVSIEEWLAAQEAERAADVEPVAEAIEEAVEPEPKPKRSRSKKDSVAQVQAALGITPEPEPETQPATVEPTEADPESGEA